MFEVKARLPIKNTLNILNNPELWKYKVSTLVGLRKSFEETSKSSTKASQFEIGSKVLVLRPQLRKIVPVSKLLPRYLGPYTIQRRLSHNLYQVESESKDLKVFHASRLIKFFSRSTLAEGWRVVQIMRIRYCVN
ncbi:hypothetical protein BB559_002933 [Furculomyces boomerangus]|uniref:Integrase p58-like C-terminal domain-containing protein n=2 Tax=Harpellales TaxID=61421 RepID=A0A2T9YQZ4_9FUNG|nr:hypothetical protein BB559_002933 [Furculomyces boomerangus]PVZ97861.1 hypothetical protein BB558_006170 [Smittium angustum]